MAEKKKIPLTFQLAYAGALGLPLFVLGAVAVRSPVFPDDGGVASVSASVSDHDDAAPHSTTSLPPVHPVSSGTPIKKPVVVIPTDGPAPKNGATVVGSTSDIRAAIDDFQKKVRFNALAQAIPALEHLIEIDPDASKDAHAEIVDLAQRIMGLKGPEPDQMYEILVTKMGTDGLDILYEMVTTKGGSDAAVYSKKLLDRADILARGTPAMQVAYKLREAKGCDETKGLFPEIREHGDGRSLGQLYLIGKRRCSRYGGTCCLENDKDLDTTIKTLQAKGMQ